MESSMKHNETVEYWSLFGVPEVELPAVYDGHTPTIAAERMAKYLLAKTV